MLRWHFAELVKGPVAFEEEFDYSELIDLRFDLVSFETLQVTGTIQFDGKKGKLQMKIELAASVLAANTGEVIPFNDEIEVVETISLLTTEYVNSEAESIDLTEHVQSMIDVLIPLYIVDDNNTVPITSGQHWTIIDEDDYVSPNEVAAEQKKLSNLSELLAKKNK